MRIRQVSLTIGVVAFLSVMPASGVEADGVSVLKSPRTILRIANKEVNKLGLNYHELDVQVDDQNRKWRQVMSILKESDSVAQKTFREYEAKLQGRTYQAVYYRPKSVDGYGTKGGGATVLIDAQTGEVLIVIRGE